MTVFSKDRKKVKAAAGRVIEALESRTLLSAALTSPISNISVAQDSAPTVIPLDSHFDDPTVAGETTVEINTPNGSIPIELFDTVTPQTVANFLDYVDAHLYDNTIIHRSVSQFVIQGGSFDTSGNPISTPFGTVPSEAHFQDNRGTIAMALGANQQGQTDPNSATSGWFINTVDNHSLDTPQNGPFTVFGQVLYNGMTHVDAINNLPTVPANTLNPNTLPSSFPLPLEVAGAGTGANNLVTVTVTRAPHVSLVMSSDNPALVTPTLGANDQMTLTYGAGLSGFAHITVTATDLGGNQVSQTFRVHVTGATPGDVAIGAGTALTSAVWTQPDGTVVTEKVSGPGSLTLAFANAVSTLTKGKAITITGSNLDPEITVTGATGSTKLTLTASKGSKIGRVGDVNITGDLGTLTGKGINLDGDLNISGSAKSITLNNANNGAITIGGGLLALALKTTAAITDEVITSGSAIKSISTPAINGTNQATSSLTAPVVGSISVTKGGISNTAITLTGGAADDLAKLSIKGAALSLFINSTGGLGAISAASMVNTIIYAGIGAMSPGQVLPNFPGDFASVQSIKSVKVKTGKTPTFSNSSIAAEVLGSLSLGRVETNNNGTSFGVAATSISSITGTDQENGKKISAKKVTAANISALLAKLGFGLGDFVVKMF